MFDKSIDHGNDVMVVQFGEKEKLQQNWTSKLSYTVKKNRQQFSMVCTLINHENDVKKCSKLYSETTHQRLMVPL